MPRLLGLLAFPMKSLSLPQLLIPRLRQQALGASAHSHWASSESWRQKVEQWFPGAGGRGKWGRLLTRYIFSCTRLERMLKMNSGYVA